MVRGARTIGLLTSAVLVLAVSTPPPSAYEGVGRQTLDAAESALLFSVTVGEDLHYEGGGVESQLWGPTGIAVDESGIIWIGDGPTHQLVGFAGDGTVVRRIDLGETVVGIGDIEVSQGQLVVLDIAAMQPKIVIVDPVSEQVHTTVDLPDAARLEIGLSGIEIEYDGTIIAEIEGGTSYIPVAQLSQSGSVEFSNQGRREFLQTPLGAVSLERNAHGQDLLDGIYRETDAILHFGDTRASITVPNILGSVRPIGDTPTSLFVQIEEISQGSDGTVLVDTTVRQFDINGEQVSSSRIPMPDAPIGDYLEPTTTADGRIIAAVPNLKAVNVYEFSPQAGDKPMDILPPIDLSTSEIGNVRESRAGTGGTDATAASCVYSRTMSANASAYYSNSRYLSATNISGTCTGRTKPRYLGSAGTYSSVPYDWGGFSSVGTFNSQMAAGTGKAGNINYSGSVLMCSYGVDCSGFVSRVWGLSSKRSTRTLPEISFTVPIASGRLGDIFNLAGSHTIMYRSVSSGGYYVAESTMNLSLDRVVARWVSSSHVSGYSFRRYVNWCCDPAVEMCPQSEADTSSGAL